MIVSLFAFEALIKIDKYSVNDTQTNFKTWQIEGRGAWSFKQDKICKTFVKFTHLRVFLFVCVVYIIYILLTAQSVILLISRRGTE